MRLCYLSLNTKAFRDHRLKNRIQNQTKRRNENKIHFGEEATINQTAHTHSIWICQLKFDIYFRQQHCVSRSNCLIPSLWIKLITILWKFYEIAKKERWDSDKRETIQNYLWTIIQHENINHSILHTDSGIDVDIN